MSAASPEHAPAANPSPLDPPSLCATGVILYVNDDTGQLIAMPAFCHRWDCDYCSAVRVRRARAIAAAGKPERMIVLTSRPDPSLDLISSIRWFRERWKRLLERLRRNFPRTEYMAFVELHKSQWPHMHILTKGCYIPQRLLQAWWKELTGAHRVRIEKIHKGWSGIQEATKYYLKTARQVHEAAPRLPVYTTSRGWLPEDWKEGDRPPGNYTFYCFARMPWKHFLEELSEAHVRLAPLADHPGRYVVEFTGPPDAAYLRMSYAVGDYAQQDLAAYLGSYYDETFRGSGDLSQAQARAEYLTDPESGIAAPYYRQH